MTKTIEAQKIIVTTLKLGDRFKLTKIVSLANESKK